MKNISKLGHHSFSRCFSFTFGGIKPADAINDKPVAIFYSPHQDDELLTMGVAIKNHVQSGLDVHVVLLTDGSASNAINAVNVKLSKEKKKQLTKSEFVEARNNEFIRSNLELGVPAENIHIEKLKDGKTNTSQMESVILKYESKFPGAKHKTFSYIDNHIDHANAGKALLNLYKKGKVQDARFYIQKDEFDSKNKKLKTYFSERYDTSYYDSLKRAATSYMKWAPEKGYYAIGYTSVKGSFDRFLEQPTSYYHKPDQNL